MLNFLSSIYFAFLGSYCVLAVAYGDRSLRQLLDRIFFLISALLVVVCAIRINSPDQNTYSMIFDLMPDLTAFTNASRYMVIPEVSEKYFWVDYGLALFMSALKTLSLDQIWMFAIVAFINISVAAWFCRRFSPEPILSFCLFMSWYFYPTIGAMRHGFAMAMFMLLFGYVLDKKWLKTATIGLIGVSVHKILLMLAPFYFAFRFFGYQAFMLQALIVCFVIAFFGGGAFFLTFELLGDFMPIQFADKIMDYRNAYLAREDSFGGPINLKSGLLLKSVLVCFALLFFYKGMDERFPGYNILSASFIFGTCTMLFAADFKILADRTNQLFSLSEIVLLPILMHRTRPLWVGRFVIITLAIIQMFLLYGSQLRPYETNLLS